MGHKWTFALVLLGVLCGLGIEASSWHMSTFISALKKLEDSHPDMTPVDLLSALRKASALTDPLPQHYLGQPESVSPFHPDEFQYFTSALHYRITDDNKEVGVVFTSDGTTVALRPLLLGIEAGFLKRPRWDTESHPDSVAVTNKTPESEQMGPDGYWDDHTNPQTFTLSHKPSLLTTAQVHGGMDGVILAREALRSGSLKLSALLTSYYDHHLGPKGMDAAPRVISQRRRDNFKELMETSESCLGVFKMEAVGVVETLRRMKEQRELSPMEKKQMQAVIHDRVKELLQMYSACPTIIPRSQWGAAPYIGSPTYLNLPVDYYFIHHTYSPRTPCLTFSQCAADMRAIQAYHQGPEVYWSDIGYNFVVGGDGNIYEGRGWNWMGAHTYGYNSVGLGVSYIGDFTYSLPSSYSISLVRDKLAACAVSGGRLWSNYILKGHRQMDNTECPGDALYNEIRRWPHFRNGAGRSYENESS